MRAFVFFLLASTVSMVAQAAAPARPNEDFTKALLPASPKVVAAKEAAAAASEAMNAPVTPEGKVKIGFEGRGDYRKPKVKEAKTAAKTTGTTLSPALKVPSTGVAPNKDAAVPAAVLSTETAATVAAAIAPPVEKPGMRSDSALRDDSSAANDVAKQAQAAATVQRAVDALTPPTAPMAVPTTNTTNSGLNGPMMVVGGKLVRPE
ncbi:MAG: hypothetical protein ACOYNL_02085 [Rickettsiales bacterium]